MKDTCPGHGILHEGLIVGFHIVADSLDQFRPGTDINDASLSFKVWTWVKSGGLRECRFVDSFP